jgi:hypothetical protein
LHPLVTEAHKSEFPINKKNNQAGKDSRSISRASSSVTNLAAVIAKPVQNILADNTKVSLYNHTVTKKIKEAGIL